MFYKIRWTHALFWLLLMSLIRLQSVNICIIKWMKCMLYHRGFPKTHNYFNTQFALYKPIQCTPTYLHTLHLHSSRPTHEYNMLSWVWCGCMRVSLRVPPPTQSIYPPQAHRQRQHRETHPPRFELLKQIIFTAWQNCHRILLPTCVKP